MRTSEEIKDVSAAIVAAQKEMPAVPKSARNPHFKSRYAPLDAIVKATAPVLAKHGLAVVQGGGDGEAGRVVITTRILHKSGQWIESDLAMKPQRDDAQGVGACVTYGSRYGYRMLGVITDEDDDGNGASKPRDDEGLPASGLPKHPPAKDCITDKQRKRLYTIATKGGLTNAESKAALLDGGGWASSKDIPKGHSDEAEDYIRTAIAQKAADAEGATADKTEPMTGKELEELFGGDDLPK